MFLIKYLIFERNAKTFFLSSVVTVSAMTLRVYPRHDDVTACDAAGKVKMADVSGTELSEEKEAETELRKRQKRPWEDFHKPGKVGLTADLPETLGFYDIRVARREQRELSAGNRRLLVAK